MPRSWKTDQNNASVLRRQSAAFARDESGTMTIFATYMILMMILVCGIGVDLMRNEMERTNVQATMDRAILAAADLDQTLDPEGVVNDYFAKAGLSQFLTSVTVDEGINYRTVSAVAKGSSPTQFMHLMGVDELPVPAGGTAEERVENVEISLVLDISGSMGRDSKMENLQVAANAFVDTVLQDKTDDLISISLIPYTAQVNAGPDIFDALRTDKRHNYSHCIDFEPDDFLTTTLSFTRTYEQMQHFEEGYNYYSSQRIGNPGCPQQDYERIVPFSQNKTSLKATINNYRARANTSIHLGMKWGVAMLDPSFRPITQDLALDNKIDSAFANRPQAYDDVETIKTILLMTDGENVNTTRIQPWYYNSSSEYVHWSKYPLYWYLNNHNVGSWNNWRYTKYTSGQADTMLSNICDAAKAKGIIVWSIGFEVTNHSAGVMEDCASSPSHFFRVEGIEITEAFEAIAKQINQLRLTQ